MPPCFTVTGGQSFAELAGVRKDMCRESRGQSFAELAGIRRICAGNPGTGLCRACRYPQDMCRESWDIALQNLPVSAGYVPGILGHSFAEFAGIRRMCAGNPGTGLCRACRYPQDMCRESGGQSFAELAGVRKDMCRESGDRALRTSPESLACL